MSSRRRKRSLASLEALVRLRRIRERRALTELTESRVAVEQQAARRRELQAQRERILEDMAPSVASQESSAQAARQCIAQRRYLEVLRQREEETERRAARLRGRWAALQSDFARARAGRRASEAYRDRRANELEANSTALGEALEGGGEHWSPAGEELERLRVTLREDGHRVETVLEPREGKGG